MRYYVVTDVHGFYSELRLALQEKGFFSDPNPHKLVVCGDLFDRGSEAVKLQEFILELMARDAVILVRGNHEDLLLRFLWGLPTARYLELHHISNGTVDTVCQLTDTPREMLLAGRESVGRKMLNGALVRRILPAMTDYYETQKYIFVHGWIPCTQYRRSIYRREYAPLPDWRNADQEEWEQARWINGMEAAHGGAREPGKTIVCGHWHCSFGHAKYEGRGGEFEDHPDFSPYYAEGIIALDACTAYTGRVNCIVLEDEPMPELPLGEEGRQEG